MKQLINTIYIVTGLLLATCQLTWAQSRCAHCGMDIKKELFRSSVQQTGGELFEFDAIECLVNYMKAKDQSDYTKLEVTDYLTGTPIPAKTAFYLKSKKRPSPMGAYLTAYANKEEAQKQRAKAGGEVYDWETLLERFVSSDFGHIGHHHHSILSYGPAGITGDHLHPKGGLMISARYMYMFMEGNRQGSERIEDAEVFNSYMVVPQEMKMHMAMLGMMYAPSDKITLMLMQNFIWKNMDLTARMMMGNGMIMFNDFSTSSSFLGDMKLGMLYGLYAGTKNSLHLNTAFNIPIGDIENRDDTPMMNSVKLPYAMQLGTGTFDITIGATFKGEGSKLSYGIQQLNTFRTGENSQGYRFGNLHELHSWLSYGFNDIISSSIRLSGSTLGSLKGQDPELNPMMVTTADPANYGGDIIHGGLGLNALLANNNLILGLEVNTPLYQNYNGIQMDEKWRLGASVRYNIL